MAGLENIVKALTEGASPKLGTTVAKVGPSVGRSIRGVLYGQGRKIEPDTVYMPAWLRAPENMGLKEKISISPEGNLLGHQGYPVNTKVPEEATHLGYNTPVFHSTDSLKPFDKFRTTEGELGIHGGTPYSALERAADSSSSEYSIMPLLFRAKNPIESPDMGSWNPRKISEFLYDKMGWRDPTINIAKKLDVGDFPSYPHFRKAREALKGDVENLIKSKGYDSFRYKNEWEAPGIHSWMVLHPDQVRVPWAKFDPSKVSSGNIYAGAAGAASLPAISGWLKAKQPDESNNVQ